MRTIECSILFNFVPNIPDKIFRCDSASQPKVVPCAPEEGEEVNCSRINAPIAKHIELVGDMVGKPDMVTPVVHCNKGAPTSCVVCSSDVPP